MKAITLIQPWATLVAIGAKKIETRSWSTNYRGALAIHAAKDTKYISMRGKLYICDEHPFYDVLMKAGKFLWESHMPGAFPLGCIIATCELTVVYPITKQRYPRIEPEFSFGNYTPGRFAWLLENVKILPEPIPAKGMLGLWNWNAEALVNVL